MKENHRDGEGAGHRRRHCRHDSGPGLADQGFEVVLLEKETVLGGLGNRLHHTIEGADIRQFVADLAARVEAHDKVQVLKQALIVDFSGYNG